MPFSDTTARLDEVNLQGEVVEWNDKAGTIK